MSEQFSAVSKQLLEAFLAKFKTMGQDFIKFVKISPQYFMCSIFYYILSSLLLGGFIRHSFGITLFFYIISLFIAFTPLGEKLLRFFEHVRKLETKQEKKYLLPIFEEVYAQAKENNPELGHIELCIVDTMTVNACALGKHTIAITEGAIETFSPDELKALVAHEIAHILHGDSIARLYTTVGNGVFTAFVLVAKAGMFIAEWIEMIATKSKSSFSFAWVFITLMKFLSSLILIVTQVLTQAVLSNSNKRSEFRADRYAYELGYGEKLVEAFHLLKKLQMGANATIVQRMTASHPRITARIERLETLIDQENAMQTDPFALN